MATPPDAVRTQLTVVTAAAAAEVSAAAASAAPERALEASVAAAGLVVPAYYDAAGTLAVAWYDELRDEARPATPFTPEIVGEAPTEWIEREAARFMRELDAVDVEAELAAMTAEVEALVAKEVARGFRDSITGNTSRDPASVGWSRVARPGACKFCVMLADKGAVFRQETARFAAHLNCHCAARPEFEGGDHGPEATVEQYLASQKRRTDAQRAQVRAYLNENYPDARG